MAIVDRVLYNGKILTQDERRPLASALAIGGGRILAVGNDEEMLALTTAGTKRENLVAGSFCPD